MKSLAPLAVLYGFVTMAMPVVALFTPEPVAPVRAAIAFLGGLVLYTFGVRKFPA